MRPAVHTFGAIEVMAEVAAWIVLVVLEMSGLAVLSGSVRPDLAVALRTALPPVLMHPEGSFKRDDLPFAASP